MPSISLVSNPNSNNDNDNKSEDFNSTTSLDSQGRRRSLLYSLCKRWAWEAIAFRCEQYPHEADASIRDHNGDTLLHWVCFGNPPANAVRALLSASPELASSPNNNGLLPLHVASSYRASSEVIRLLIAANPVAIITQNKSGSLPLHLFCDYGASVDGIRAFLETEEGVASVKMSDKTFGQKPLSILNSRKNITMFLDMIKTLRSRRCSQDLIRSDTSDDDNHEDAMAELERIEEQIEEYRQQEFWQKLVLLIQAEYTQKPLGQNDDPTRFIVHACTAIECPPPLMELAMLLHPEQLITPNEDGLVPLHLAAARPGVSILNDILHQDKKAAMLRDHEGRLPVQVAVAFGRRWGNGVGCLLAAHPVGIESLNVDERLYPLYWSKLIRKGGINSVYVSLRSKPSVFHGA